MWRLTALPREEFDATYGEMPLGLWRCVATPVGADLRSLKDQALTCAVAALRIETGRFQKSRRTGCGGAVRVAIRGLEKCRDLGM